MRLSLGLIGSGFMGQAHALAYANVNRVFPGLPAVERAVLADIDADRAAKAAALLGFGASTGDWTSLVARDDVDVVAITSPNLLHKPMALAAIRAGKHVHCEKPLAPTSADALEMALAAEKAGVVTAVGFNYLKNPMLKLAGEIVESGEIGEIRTFNGIHAEDFMMDAAIPWTWRLDPAGGGGVLPDLGSHIVATARYLLGPIAEVLGDVVHVIRERPEAPGSRAMRAVAVEDVGRAFVRFANGCTGSLQASWIESGRKMRHDFEITGSKGGLIFSQERFNELELFVADDRAGRQGFRRIFAGPEHPPYGHFCVAGGHQLGFNDLKTIEVWDFLRAIAGQASGHADFREGLEVQRTLEAIYTSAAAGRWTRVG